MPLNPWKRSNPSIITLADRARDSAQWHLAAAYYLKALRRNPRNPPIWVQYGHVLREAGHLAEAEKAYRTALTYDPRCTEPYVYLSVVLKLRGKGKQAESAY